MDLPSSGDLSAHMVLRGARWDCTEATLRVRLCPWHVQDVFEEQEGAKEAGADRRRESGKETWEPEAGSSFVGLGRHRREFGSYSESMPEGRHLSKWARKATQISL